jgi:anti-anti-sigma factor
MSDDSQPVFLVNAYSDPVVVRIAGKANYLNCNAFRDFMEAMLEAGKNAFVLDFKDCTGMDSTFLGILAGTALELQAKGDSGEMVLCRLNPRNTELICNLGLENLLTLHEGGGLETDAPFSREALEGLDNEEVSHAATVLRAHENLVRAEKSNAPKFQDVIAFLRNQVDEENG